MDCGELKEKISAYVDGEASSGEIRRIDDHLAACASCRALAGRMRALGTAVERIEGEVPSDFRERLFARMEKEELLPRRRSIFVYSLRWAAVPLAAAAALAIFLLAPKEQGIVIPQGGPPRVAQRAPEAPAPSQAPPRVATRVPEVLSPVAAPPASSNSAPQATAIARGAHALTAEEREILANLEVLEVPSVFEDPGPADEMEIVAPAGKRQG